MKVSVQPLMAAVPVLVMVMLLVSPVFHALTALLTRQVPVPPGLVVGAVVGQAGFPAPQVMALVCRYSSMPAVPHSRPRPLCL